MARSLTAIAKSTPTYLFRITDMESAGVDISDMNIMMALSFTDDEGEQELHYVFEDGVDLSFFDVDNSSLWQGSNYCIKMSSGLYAITVPFWKLGFTPTTATYQVFLFANTPVSGIVGVPTRKALAGTEETVNQLGLIRLHNIMIDSGTITFLPSLLPLDLSKNPRSTEYRLV